MKFSKFGGKWNLILHCWFGHGNLVENRQNEKQDRMHGCWSSAGKWKAILYHLAAKSRCHRLTSATHVVQIPQTLERRSEKCLWYHKTLNARAMKQMLKYPTITKDIVSNKLFYFWSHFWVLLQAGSCHGLFYSSEIEKPFPQQLFKIFSGWTCFGWKQDT